MRDKGYQVGFARSVLQFYLKLQEARLFTQFLTILNHMIFIIFDEAAYKFMQQFLYKIHWIFKEKEADNPQASKDSKGLAATLPRQAPLKRFACNILTQIARTKWCV